MTPPDDAVAALLLGRWRKMPSAGCARAYPPALEFLPSGMFQASAPDPAERMMFDRGEYRLRGTGSLQLQMANDAFTTLAMLLDGARLTLRDGASCEVAYEREER